MPEHVEELSKVTLTTDDSVPAGIDAVESKSRPKGTSLETILSLRKRGFSLAECGKQLGISKQAVGAMLKRSGVDVEAVERYKLDKPLIFNAKQKILIDALTPKVVAKMDGKSLLIGAGILQDKLDSMERGALAGLNANMWVAIVAQSHKPEVKDVTPTGEVVE